MATNMEGSSLGKDSEERKCVKILILGDFGIGKTTLIKTYLRLDDDIPGEFLHIFEEYHTGVKHNGKGVDVVLYDSRSGPTAPERRGRYPVGVNAILLCFSIGHYETLKGAYNLWIHEARAQYGERKPIFLVGLRSDVRFLDCPIEIRSPVYPNDRIVEKSEAENVHRNFRLYGEYKECSKHDRLSVVHVFSQAILAAMEN